MVWEPASNKTYMHQKKKKTSSCPIHFPTKMQLGTQESKHIVNSCWPKCHSLEWHSLVMRDVRAPETDHDCRANLGICYCAISQTSFPDTLQEGSSPFPSTFNTNLISTSKIGQEHILHLLILLPSEALPFHTVLQRSYFPRVHVPSHVFNPSAYFWLLF